MSSSCSLSSSRIAGFSSTRLTLACSCASGTAAVGRGLARLRATTPVPCTRSTRGEVGWRWAMSDSMCGSLYSSSGYGS